MGVPSRSTSLPSAAAAPRMMDPKTSSTASYSTKVWTNVGERTWSSVGTSGDGTIVVPVPSGSSVPARATNLLLLGGDSAPPLGGAEGSKLKSLILSSQRMYILFRCWAT